MNLCSTGFFDFGALFGLAPLGLRLIPRSIRDSMR